MAPSLLPAWALLLLCLPLFLTDTVPPPDQELPTTDVQEAEIPTALDANLSYENGGDAGCKNPNGCGIHVFRVALSSRPEEVGDFVHVKQRKKYGSNVYVPRGSQDSFVLQDLAANLPAYIDSRVKDRIHDQDFVIKRVDMSSSKPNIHWVKEGEPLPKNFEPMRNLEVTTPVSKKDSGMPFYQILLLVITSVLFGILFTATCVACVIYNRRPRIDRSSVVTHRRGVSYETLPLPLSYSSDQGSYPPLQLPSSARTTDSSRSTFDGSMELAVFDDSSYRTRSTNGHHPHTSHYTSSEYFSPLSRKISI